MTEFQWRGLRHFILHAHLYVSLGLGLLLVPIAISGAALVWRDDVDRLLNPSRYEVTGSEIALSPSAYLAKAAAAAGPDQRPAELRYPDAPGWPVRVTTRSAPAAGRGPGSLVVYLDPPTGNALGVIGLSASAVGVLHNFHHMLSAPQISGRQIVGWIGVGMLFLSLSGIYLWWPRNSGFLRGLRWRRSPWTTTNLHQLLGFWISIPLAIVSLTGIYMSFPRTAFAFMSSIAAVSGEMQHGYGALPASRTNLDADRALQMALDVAPGATPLAISLPVAPRAGHDEARHGEHAGHDGLAWNVRVRADGETQNVMIDDALGFAHIMPAPAGDNAVAWINWIHEGRRGGPVWAAIVFLTGVFPLVFLITGVIMWLRGRAARKMVRSADSAQIDLQPAE